LARDQIPPVPKGIAVLASGKEFCNGRLAKGPLVLRLDDSTPLYTAGVLAPCNWSGVLCNYSFTQHMLLSTYCVLGSVSSGGQNRSPGLIELIF
jgi:hypothetical protein